MADKEHLAQLKRGVENWNRWREENPNIKPNLSKAKLSKTHLPGINLNDADLSNANLSEAVLGEAELEDANLSYSNLVETYLGGANLSGANFNWACLLAANLSGADLSMANLIRADLMAACLDGAFIAGASLNSADLTDADLTNVDLREALLVEAVLQNTCLVGADLRKARLWGANLSNADFRSANLSEANLVSVHALATNFTETVFTGACIEDWNINNVTQLDGAICDYIYLKNPDFERRPLNGVFSTGEFATLFQKALETVDLIFADGIDWSAFFHSLENIKTEYGKGDLSVQAIEKKSGNAFIIRLEVAPGIDRVAIEQRAKELYELQLTAIQESSALQSEQLDFYRQQIDIERQKSTELSCIIKTLAANQAKSLEAIKTMAEKENSRVIHTGGGNYIESNAGTYVQGNYINMSQDLAHAAVQIQELIDHLQKQGVAVDIAQEQVAKDISTEARNDPTMQDKLVKWGQSLGDATVSDVVKGIVKLAIRSAGIPLP